MTTMTLPNLEDFKSDLRELATKPMDDRVDGLYRLALQLADRDLILEPTRTRIQEMFCELNRSRFHHHKYPASEVTNVTHVLEEVIDILSRSARA